MQIPSGLIDLVYDAALDSSLWPTVLERVSDVVGGGATALLYQNQRSMRGFGLTTRLDPSALSAYYGEFRGANPLTMHNLRAIQSGDRNLGTITDRDVLSKERFVRTDYYGAFARPNGMHSALMLGLTLNNENLATFNVMRPHTRNEFDKAELEMGELIRPHLSRAFCLTQRLSDLQQTNRALGEFIDRSPHGLFLIDNSGVVQQANRAGEKMLREGNGLRLSEGHLGAQSGEVTRTLQKMIWRASEPGDGRVGGSMTIARPDHALPLSVIVAPVNRENASLFSTGPAAIVCVSDPDSDNAPPAEHLREMFGLTPAEARVALELLEGHDTRAIAQRLKLSFNTVRVHLARIMDKTHTTRQAELVRLMMRIAGMYAD